MIKLLVLNLSLDRTPQRQTRDIKKVPINLAQTAVIKDLKG